MEEKSTTPGAIETHVRTWGAELDRLKAKVDKEYYEHIEDLRDDITARIRKWAREVENVEPTAGARTVEEQDGQGRSGSQEAERRDESPAKGHEGETVGAQASASGQTLYFV